MDPRGRHPLVHLELHTGNLAWACSFYTRLFGWRAEYVRVGSQPYLVLAPGGTIEGGVVEEDIGRPTWLPYVEVADVWESTERARLLGASVMVEPREGPAGWRSVLASESGGEVALWQRKRGADNMTESTTSETRRLAALVGRWKTEGETRESRMTIDASDTYEWLPGGFALLHRVDALVGEEKVEGAEIIGYDPERGCYITQYFGSDGPNAYEARLEDDGACLVWRMQSSTDRFTGTFSADRERIEGHWEQLGPDSRWTPWMDITLTKRD